MKLTGRAKVIGNTNQVTDKFKKRDLVLTIEESSQYPQDILIQTSQDKVDLLNDIQVGQQIEVDINLRGREWTNPQGEVKYFNTIEAWRISVIGGQVNTPPPAQPEEPSIEEDDDDLLPF